MKAIQNSYIAVVVTLFLAAGTGCATPILQLPFHIAAQMSGEWAVEVRSSCKPPVVRAVAHVNQLPQSADEDEFRLKLEAASEGAVEFDVGGITVLIGGLERKPSLSFTICAQRANVIKTPQRPWLEGLMESTRLTEFTGLAADTGNATLHNCGSALPNLFIRTIGGDVSGASYSSNQLRDSLHYIEMDISVPSLTAHCTREDAENEDHTYAEGKRKRHRGGVIAGVREEAGDYTDKRVLEGGVIVRLTRRTFPEKSFLEQHFLTVLLSLITIVYRVVQGFNYYRYSHIGKRRGTAARQ
uniref:Uncharacterized protein n=1 Tax=Trypanosoma vivax (strain Y486) TaxID=1055687 RepID=G0TS82_TRYVY|nr:conserved hypothetical protein [Trypanosoma vivax Y486]